MMHLRLSGMRFLIWQRGTSSVSEGALPARASVVRLLTPIAPADTGACVHKKYSEHHRRHLRYMEEQV